MGVHHGPLYAKTSKGLRYDIFYSNKKINVTFLSAAVLCLNSTKQQHLKMHLIAALYSMTKFGGVMNFLFKFVATAFLICNSTTLLSKESMSSIQNPAIQLLNNFSDSQSPGIQYIVANKNSIIFKHSVGLADVESSTPLSMSHTLAGFSMTKTLTAIAILQLVEHDKLGLDTPVIKYVNHPYDSNITIRQLITHTAGLPNPIPLKWVHLAENHHDFNEPEALSHILNNHNKMESKPGASYEYSNIGYWLLGSVIESITEKSYSNYVIENIFKPLSLSPQEINFQILDEKKHAKGYLKKWSFMNLFGRFFIDNEILGEYEQNWLHIKNNYLNGPSFGGVIGTSKALVHILQDLLRDQSALLSPASKKLLYEQHEIEGEKIDMTLGWHKGNLDGISYYYKEGGGAGFHGEMRIYPDVGIVSVLMTNRTSFNSRNNMSELDILFIKHGI